MAYKIIANKEQGIKDFIVDDVADLDALPTYPMGSTAFVINTAQLFILNSEGVWKEV